MTGLCFAYYCSGHGFGHATRVSAFASHLLSLTPQPIIHIVSSAPKYVFSESIALGALYKYSEIDPVIVQPLAYRVDRQKSVDVLKAFLDRKNTKLEEERAWLVEIKADCVLSDAAFLGCLAANAAAIPSILVTNFTFDSVYSYLSAPLIDGTSDPSPIYAPPLGSEGSRLFPPSRNGLPDFIPDIPVPQFILAPLVDQIHAGYQCADLLMLLPGAIPIPSFSSSPSLPSPDWVDCKWGRFTKNVVSHLTGLADSSIVPELLPQIPFASACKPRSIPRSIMHAPLLVRSPTGADATSARPSPFTPEGRSLLLSSIGIPPHQHDPATTNILVVSFGGQVFRRVGSRNGSRSRSRASSPTPTGSSASQSSISSAWSSASSSSSSNSSFATSPPMSPREPHTPKRPKLNTSSTIKKLQIPPPRLITDSHMFIPGAPPVSKPFGSPTSPQSPKLSFCTRTIPPSQPGTPRNISPSPRRTLFRSISNLNSYFDPDVIMPDVEEEVDIEPRGLLPDDSWIAIVCGVSKEQWNAQGGEDEGLPEGFYVAPKDIYMPDLTAVADVLLGKLGYGTVSECVDSCTPFVYVSRPLFIEEHGLRLLLSRSGVGVELSRMDYEAGEWAGAVEEAWIRGRDQKIKRNQIGVLGGLRRKEEGREMAERVTGWVEQWWEARRMASGV